MLQKFCEYEGHKFSLYALAKNTENSFFSADGNGTVAEWQIGKADGKALIILKEPVFSLKKFQDNLFIGSQWGNLFVWKQGQKKITGLKFPYKAIFDMHIVGESLFLATETGVLLELNLQDYTIKNAWQIARRSLRTLLFCSGLHLLFVGDSEGNISYFSLTKKKTIQKIKAHSSSVFTLAFDGSFLFSGSRDSFLKKWKISTGKLENSTIAHQSTINKILLFPERNLLITAGKDAQIMLWKLSDFQFLTQTKEHKFSVNTLLKLNSTTFLSAGDDNRLIQWTLDNEQ